MRQITLATVTLATLVFASAAYADSNYGPIKKGNQCWNHRGVSTMDSLGYWGKCTSQEGGASAQAKGAKAKDTGKSKTANTPTR
jgi:hypothetical protein